MAGRLRFKLKANKINRSVGGNIALFIFLAAGGVFMGLPIVYTIINAFKPMEELFLFPPRFLVLRPVLDNFSSLFQLTANLLVPFPRYLFNTLFVTVFGSVFYIYIASMAAYPLAHIKFAGKTILYNAIVFSLLMVPEVLDVPRYIIMSNIGIIDTYYSLLFPTFAGTLGVFLMERFMVQFPTEIIESAKIDGCSAFATFNRIVMPNMKPAWLTLLIFVFTALWNSSGNNVIYSENLKMVSTVLSQLSFGGISRAGVGAAVALFMLIPPMIVFIVVQSSVMETMAHAGLKG